jgi:hypothetical protein
MSSLDHLIVTVVGARRAEAREPRPAPEADPLRRSGAGKPPPGTPDPSSGRGEINSE